MMDSACAEYGCATQAETGCWNRNPTACFCYDLCQTVYLSPQICIPTGDVDACLSMECCVSVFFRLLSKTLFSMVLFSHFGAGGERHGSIRRVLFESLRVMHDDFSIFRTMIR